MFQNINGVVKIKHDKKNNDISIRREITGFNYDLPTIYIFYSNDNHYMFGK